MFARAGVISCLFSKPKVASGKPVVLLGLILKHTGMRDQYQRIGGFMNDMDNGDFGAWSNHVPVLEREDYLGMRRVMRMDMCLLLSKMGYTQVTHLFPNLVIFFTVAEIEDFRC
jgi:hypothetical protein